MEIRLMRFNDFAPPGTITGSELALRLAFIRQLERDTGRKMPTTIEGNIRAWEHRRFVNSREPGEFGEGVTVELEGHADVR